MSTIYDTEPQPTASVILHTTGGEIAVELFAKQTPLTSRNFLQHCLDGYYDNTLFHRLVPGFVLQGGDPTNSGNGGESIYDAGALSGDLDPWPMDQRKGHNAGPQGINFKDEFHTRLKFNRRGLLGMANEGQPDTNGSQFFFTLDKADELNGKNTMFGRVSGQTIYNLAKMGQAEVQEGTDRPLYPSKVTHVEILTNPFTDMRKTERVARHQEAAAAVPAEKKKAKRKKGVNKILLSFGDELGDEEDEDGLEVSKGSHKKAKIDKSEKNGKNKSKSDGSDAKPREEQPMAYKTTLPSRAVPAAAAPPPAKIARERSASLSESESEPEPEPRKKQPSALEKTNAEIAALKASMRRTVHEAPVKAEETKRSALEQLVPSNATRGKKLRPDQSLSSHDPKVLKFLGVFQSKLGPELSKHDSKAQPTAAAAEAEAEADAAAGDAAEEGEGQVCDLHFIANCQSCRPWDQDEEGKDESEDEEWMSHKLDCEADKLGKDLSYRKKAEDELIVIDPREKARTLKEDKKSARDARGGDGGRSGRRDQARHAKMAGAAAMSGRGAR